MEELRCISCRGHLGWISDNSPRGFVKCDSCHQSDIESEEGCSSPLDDEQYAMIKDGE